MNGSFHTESVIPRLVSMSVRLYLVFLLDHSSTSTGPLPPGRLTTVW